MKIHRAIRAISKNGIKSIWLEYNQGNFIPFKQFPFDAHAFLHSDAVKKEVKKKEEDAPLLFSEKTINNISKSVRELEPILEE